MAFQAVRVRKIAGERSELGEETVMCSRGSKSVQERHFHSDTLYSKHFLTFQW
jgi:hypothetical protein